MEKNYGVKVCVTQEISKEMLDFFKNFGHAFDKRMLSGEVFEYYALPVLLIRESGIFLLSQEESRHMVENYQFLSPIPYKKV